MPNPCVPSQRSTLEDLPGGEHFPCRVTFGRCQKVIVIDNNALDRYRARVSDLLGLNAMVSASERRLNTTLHAIHALNNERDRIASCVHSPFTSVRESVTEKLRPLDAEIAKGKREAELLRAEVEAVRLKQEASSRLVGRLKEFLIARGASLSEVEY